MSEARSWNLPEQHLMPDAVVAFVDGELTPLARDRAAQHISRCPFCATETRTQRQARSAVRGADAPGAPASLLAALRAIPVDTELPGSSENYAVGPDGQLFAIQRPERVAGLGSSAMMGSSSPLGSGSSVLRGRAPHGRRAVQGAGMVIGGLVLGALVVVGPHMLSGGTDAPTESGVNGVNGAGLANAPRIGDGGRAGYASVGGDEVAATTTPAASPLTSPSQPPSVIPVVNAQRANR